MPSRIYLPLIRKCDRKPVGTVTVVRANHPAFTDPHRSTRASSIRIDHLLMPLTGADGEEFTYREGPMEQLLPKK
jgi:hypothetical protein